MKKPYKIYAKKESNGWRAYAKFDYFNQWTPKGIWFLSKQDAIEWITEDAEFHLSIQKNHEEVK